MIRFLVGLIGRPAMLGWALAGGMALVGGAYTLGRYQGATAANDRLAVKQAHLQSQMTRAAEIASRKEATRLVAVAKVEQLSKELEDAARTDADAGRISLGADSVRRLNRRCPSQPTAVAAGAVCSTGELAGAGADTGRGRNLLGAGSNGVETLRGASPGVGRLGG